MPSLFPAAASLAATANLKKTAKGDDKILQDKRIYLYVEASSDTLTAKIPKGNFFYSTEYSVGRVLDLAAKGLQVQNINNRSDSEDGGTGGESIRLPGRSRTLGC